MSSLYTEQGECCIEVIKKEIYDYYEKEWIQKCLAMPKLRT